jgi:hypothetical protein
MTPPPATEVVTIQISPCSSFDSPWVTLPTVKSSEVASFIRTGMKWPNGSPCRLAAVLASI